MNEREKLKHLLHHWIEHNHEHAEIYGEWAEKASAAGNHELSKILGRLHHETLKLNELIEEAIKIA
jgi:hypothetical protein